jgi:uncharacterized membrane protein YbaN (DUF454 family)
MRRLQAEVDAARSPLIRWALIVVGTISTALGIAGVLLPLLPTTPFLLLAAACYARSSRKFYVWLLTNPWVGKYIRDWRAGRGVPVRVKAVAVTMLWLALGSSIVFFVPIVWVKLLLAAIGVAVTIHLVLLPDGTE